MMYGKHRMRRYLAKRWWRIGAPMLVALFALAFLHMVKGPHVSADFGRGWGRAPGQIGQESSSSQGSLSRQLKPFDKDGDGPLRDAERKDVIAAWQKSSENVKPAAWPRPGPRGPMAFGPARGAGTPAFDFTRFMPRVGPLTRRIFGSQAHYFTLGHLWFLWYLLVFATIAPFVTTALGWLFLRPTPEAADWFGRWSIRFGVVPLALSLFSVPALMQTQGLFGWSLGMAEAIFGTFPDVLLQYQRDMPFYFVYFLAGWWLYRRRESLPDVARLWLPSLIVGCVSFMAAGAVSGVFAAQSSLPNYRLIRLGGYALYAVGSAYLAWGFLGFFQRFVDRPTRVGRYLADTAFWVYLVHQEILGPVVRGITPLRLPWWGQAVLASALTTAAALALFEIAVRPTPLNRLFGPAGPHRGRPQELHGGVAIPDALNPEDSPSAA